MLQKIERKLGIVVYFLPLVWLLLIIFILNITSPLMAGPAGILGIFCLFYACFVTCFYVVFLLLNKFGEKLKKRFIPRSRIYIMSLIFGLAPIFMIALNSLGQLGLLELILILILVGLSSFYVSKKYGISQE